MYCQFRTFITTRSLLSNERTFPVQASANRLTNQSINLNEITKGMTSKSIFLNNFKRMKNNFLTEMKRKSCSQLKYIFSYLSSGI